MNQRKPIIAGNWKMHKTLDEAVAAARRIVEITGDVTEVEVLIAPPFTALSAVAAVIRNSSVQLGGQNLFWEQKGAYTGEIAADMLRSCGCQYVIIGHSERRQFFGETDETVNRRISAALKGGLVPILCIGETETQREAGQTFSVLDKQVRKGLEGFFAHDLASLVIAYEPVWAIGTGKTASSDQAQEVHRYLRDLMAKAYGNALANSIRILYGGSVKPSNVRELMSMPDLDGALVGGASLDPQSFGQLVHYQ
jgi:triosephosphate isomerase